MKKQFCPYCGVSLDDGCDCAREATEAEAQFIEDYENSLETQYGWAQQDLIDIRKFEQ
jgi:hypothetical protein